MAINQFYVTFSFSNSFNFATIDAQKSLGIVHFISDRDPESETFQGSGGLLTERFKSRYEFEIEFRDFSREAQDPYPDGQDWGDWQEFIDLWETYRFRRIETTNAVEYTRFNFLTFPLPVERGFDFKASLSEDKLSRKVSGKFRSVRRVNR